ncbi:unnamed protein product [Peronospora belbahrii]|uniref:Uncharacterized protein n=1 Tax=Peronospora belbahrii TaxID=622444 RepID=A0AAU9L223_9STRA|nr:unnamed protein product [Peronospora belbahrii]
MVEQVKTKDLATLIHHKALQSVFRNRNVCSFQICLDHILSTTRCTELYASLTLDLASSRPYDFFILNYTLCYLYHYRLAKTRIGFPSSFRPSYQKCV